MTEFYRLVPKHNVNIIGWNLNDHTWQVMIDGAKFIMQKEMLDSLFALQRQDGE